MLLYMSYEGVSEWMILYVSYIREIEQANACSISLIISQDWLMCSFRPAADVGYDYLWAKDSVYSS